MPEELPVSNHNCTRLQLYTIVQMIINSGIGNMAALAVLKSKYIPAFFTQLNLNLSDAIALPGEEETRLDHVIFRDDLVKLLEPCGGNYRKLKVYIKDAFPASQVKALEAAAGGNLYPEAMNENWQSTKGMNNLMISFTGNPAKLATLLAGDNMPATFPAKIISDSNNFNTGAGLFMTSKQTGVATSAKITADNLCYTNVTDLCADAQVALEGFPELQKLFVFTTVKDLVSPPGSASYKLDAKMIVAFTDVEGLLVTIQEEGHPAISLTTDVNGLVHFEHINPAKYTVTITKTGLISQSFKKDVDTGTNARSSVLMAAVPPPPPPPEV